MVMASSSSLEQQELFTTRLILEVWRHHILCYLPFQDVLNLSSTCKFARYTMLNEYTADNTRLIVRGNCQQLLRKTGAKVGRNYTLHTSDEQSSSSYRTYQSKIHLSKSGKLLVFEVNSLSIWVPTSPSLSYFEKDSVYLFQCEDICSLPDGRVAVTSSAFGNSDIYIYGI